VHNAPARDQTSLTGPEESAKVPQQNGNGCFLWQPSLSANEHLDGTLAITGSLTTGGSPALKSTNGSTLVIFQNTPYTIAAIPAAATPKDPALAGATNGALITADTVGSVPVEVSVNAGATWTSIGTLSGAGAKIDFTDSVKGRNQYLLRLSFDNGEGLNSLSLRTLTVMSQAVYPTLKSGTANVTYSTTNTGALELSPDLWSAASATSATGYVQKVADSGNVTGDYYATGTYAFNSTNSNPISVTYKITMPPELVSAGATWKQIFAAGNYRVAIPPNATGHYGQIEISPNNSTWTKIGEHLPPNDNELSHFWAYGKSADATTLGGTTYYVKYTTANGGFPSSIRYLRLSATYTVPASTAPVEVTYSWNNGAAQTNVHTVAAGAGTDSWAIATGTVASQTKVAIRVGANTATPTAPSITTQPANQTVTAGQTATFSVTASGTGPLQYQWTKNGTNIAGATSASYTTPATTNADNGAVFRVTVTNAQGSVLSAAASLIVNPAPPPVGATTVTLQQGVNGYAGTVDTYIDEFVPAGTFGTLDRMEIRYYDPGTGLSEHMIGLLKFNLTSIPTTATVTSAKLTLYNTRANSNSANDVLVLDKVTSAWNDTHTWSMGVPTGVASGVTCPSLAAYTMTPNPPETFVITTGLGALVQGWVNNPASNLGMKFYCTTNLNLRFGTSEFSFPQYRPALEITYSTGGTPPADTTPPSLTITPPPATALSSPLTVTGTASDAGGISQVTWSNALTGQSGTATGTTNWSADIPLADGTNNITITVTDAAGNPTSQNFSVNYTGPSIPAPTPTPSAPTPSSGGGKSHKRCGVGSSSPEPMSPAVVALAALLLALALQRRQ
jgi:MYXO-CTERM domain-containing protein